MKPILNKITVGLGAVGLLLTCSQRSANALNLTADTLNGSQVVEDSRTGLTWLKLTETDGLSPNAALTRFPSYSWANGEAVNGLFLSLQQDFGGEVFNLSTGGISGAGSQNTAFLSLFGMTLPGGARGWYDQEVLDNSSTMIRVSQDRIIETRFIAIGDSGAARNQAGVFLVKDNIPEPIPTPALLPGLIGMGVAAIRKHKQEAELDA